MKRYGHQTVFVWLLACGMALMSSVFMPVHAASSGNSTLRPADTGPRGAASVNDPCLARGIASEYCKIESGENIPAVQLGDDYCDGVFQLRTEALTYRHPANGDVIVCTSHYVARISRVTGALQTVRHRTGTGQFAVIGEDFSAHEYSDRQRYDFDATALTNVRISIPSPVNTLGHAFYPSSSYLKVITEAEFYLPTFIGDRAMVLRRTYEFTRGPHIYEQMELVNNAACGQWCLFTLYDLRWDIHIAPTSGTVVAKSTDDLVLQYPHFDHQNPNASAHPLNLMDQKIKGYLVDSADTPGWSRQWNSPVALYRGRRLLSNAAISVLEVGDTNQWQPEVYPYPTYQLYPGFGLRAKGESTDPKDNHELQYERDDQAIACAGLPHQEMPIASDIKKYITFTDWNHHEIAQAYIPIDTPGRQEGTPQRLDALLRSGLHLLERMAHEGGWPTLAGWHSGGRDYPCGHIGATNARGFAAIAYLWAYLSLEWRAPSTVGSTVLSPWAVSNDDAWAIYEQLQETYWFFTASHPINLADEHNGTPYIAYSSHNRENDPAVPRDQKVLGAINAHATALHFIAMMRDASRLASDTPNKQRWEELLHRYHPGTRELFSLLYPAYKAEHPATKYYGFLGYSLDLKAMKDNGVGYNDITYMGIVPGYLQHQDYELAFVDTAAAVRSDADPLRPDAQPCPASSPLGPLSRALPLVLSFIQFETFPAYQTYPGSFKDDNERAQCLDLATSYPNRSHYLQSITDLEEILTFGHSPLSGVHEPEKFIREKGGRTWIKTSVAFMSDWTPGFWEEVDSTAVPEASYFDVDMPPASVHPQPRWTAYRRGDRLEIMADYATSGVEITVSADFPMANIRKRTYSNGEWSGEVALYTALRGQRQGNVTVFTLPDALNPKDLLIVELSRRPTTPGPLHHNNILDRQWFWNYLLSWGSASSTLPFWYELQEAYNTTSFTGPRQVLASTVQSRSFSQKPDGTYSYRLRACSNVGCSEWSATLQVVVRMQPSAPDGLSIQFTSANGYVLSWGEATGLVTGYELYEATQPDFSNQVLAEVANPSFTDPLLNGLNQSLFGVSRSFAVQNKAPGTYYYRVRATNGQFAGPYTVLLLNGQPRPVVPGSASTTVTISPGGNP